MMSENFNWDNKLVDAKEVVEISTKMFNNLRENGAIFGHVYTKVDDRFGKFWNSWRVREA